MEGLRETMGRDIIGERKWRGGGEGKRMKALEVTRRWVRENSTCRRRKRLGGG